MAEVKKSTWASKFKKQEGISPQQGVKEFVQPTWEKNQAIQAANIEARMKGNEAKYKQQQMSKLKQQASKTPTGSTTDKTVTPPNKTI